MSWAEFHRSNAVRIFGADLIDRHAGPRAERERRQRVRALLGLARRVKRFVDRRCRRVGAAELPAAVAAVLQGRGGRRG
jgi:hypothetical protein